MWNEDEFDEARGNKSEIPEAFRFEGDERNEGRWVDPADDRAEAKCASAICTWLAELAGRETGLTGYVCLDVVCKAYGRGQA